MKFSLQSYIQNILKILSVVFFLFGVSAYLNTEYPALEIHDMYLLFLLFIGLLLFCWPQIRIESENSFEKKDQIIFLILSAFIIALKMLFINHKTLWQDEFSEVFLSLNRPIMGCALQSQPPLECILVNNLNYFFGFSEFAARFHVVLMMILTTSIYLLLSFRILKSWIYSILLVLLFSLHPLIIQYGYEARPYSLGLFFLMILLFEIFKLVEKKNTPITKISFLKLTGIVTYFNLSLGFQAPVLCFFLLVILLFSYLLTKVKNFFLLSCAIAFGILLYLPIQLSIFKISTLAQAADFKLLEHFDRAILFLKTEQAAFLYKQLSILLGIPLFVFLFFKSKHKEIGLLLSSLTFTFYVATPLIFYLVISGVLTDRYVILGWLLICVLAIFILELINSMKHKHKKFIAGAFIFYFSLGLFLIQKNFFSYEPINIRSYYIWLNENMKPHDQIARVCISDSSSYCFNEIEENQARYFYLKKEINDQLAHQKESGTVGLFKLFIDEKVKFETLHIIVETRNKDILKNLQILKKYPQVNTMEFSSNYLLVFTGGKEQIMKNWFSFITELEKTGLKDNFYVDELLLQKAIIEKNDILIDFYYQKWLKEDQNGAAIIKNEKSYTEIITENQMNELIQKITD